MTEPTPGRQVYMILPGERLACPRGHPITKHVWAIGDGDKPMLVERCSHRVPPGHTGICGACFFWFKLPGGVFLCVEMASAEARGMEERHLTHIQVLEELGLRAPWQWPAA